MHYLLHPKTWLPLLTGSHVQPWRHVSTIAELDVAELKRLGVEAVIFDVDNTLTEHHAPAVFDAVAETFSIFKREFKVVIYSNCGIERHHELKKIFPGLPLVSQGLKKPLPAGFSEALSFLEGLKPEQVLMVGDRVMTDIVGGNRAGMRTVLTDPFSAEEPAKIRFVRKLERLHISG